MEHGASVLAAILGVLKAGKIYVPLDPRYPLSRLRFMRADAQATLIVADKKNCGASSAIAGDDCQVMESETTHSNISSNRVGLRISPDALACIYYTSGSTGQPKGVFDNQRNVLHGTLRFTGLHLSPDDRLALPIHEFERFAAKNFSCAFERRFTFLSICGRTGIRWPRQPELEEGITRQPGADPTWCTH
jgi:non-ribosomal peptide synthetase component F